MTRAQLLADIVADLAALRAAYDRAGLLENELGIGAARSSVGSPGREIAERFRRDFLLLDALVRHRVAGLAVDRGALRHVAVFGANNVGKSTVVNILMGAAIAETSPEGGHTRHAEVFVAAGPPLFGENPYAFRGFVQTALAALAGSGFDRYARVPAVGPLWPSHIAIWDTPDCDAVGSSRYLAAVVEAVAAADVVLYVTSGEHYAVEHVVEWVFRLHEAGLPFVECINKTRQRDRQRVIDGQTERIFPLMAERLGIAAPQPPIIALRYLSEGEDSALWGPAHPEAARLRELAIAAAAQADRVEAGRAALAFVRSHLDAALQPVRLEAEARRRWAVAVDAAAAAFVRAYERGYLTSTSVIEPFSRLNLAILELLDPEIPGLKETMAAIRWVTRWPSRLLLTIGRRVFSALFRGNGGGGAGEPLAPELKAYSEAHVEILSGLGRRIDVERRPPHHHPFWDSLATAWEEQLARLSAEFGTALELGMKRTEEEIRQAAADIYTTLKQRPATLRLLRGARVAANVGGALVGIVLPHHGVLFDLVEEAIVAPAMISATEAATSAVAESQVARRKERIIERLRAEARAIAARLYQEPLQQLGETAMAQAGSLGLGEEVADRLTENLLRMQSDRNGKRE